ncbi:MAG: hypothetical protein MUO51_03245 [Woeseiaceae bacterium]|nr:hypothetical protein [Woeseiaceae bacterium]
MSKRHYHDNQDDVDEATYSMLGSRFSNLGPSHAGRLQKKLHHARDESEQRQLTRKPKRDRSLP